MAKRSKKDQEGSAKAYKPPKVTLAQAIKEHAKYLYDYVFADGEYDSEREESLLDGQDPRVIEAYEKLKKDRARRERKFYAQGGRGGWDTFEEFERGEMDFAFRRKYGMSPREFESLHWEERKRVREKVKAGELGSKTRTRRKPSTPEAIRKRAPADRPSGRIYRYEAHRASWVHGDDEWRALDRWASLQPGYWANHMGPHLGLVVFEAEPEELAGFASSLGIDMTNFVTAVKPRGWEWGSSTEFSPTSRPGAAPVVKPEVPFAGKPYDVIRAARFKAMREVPNVRGRDDKIKRIGAFLKEADRRGLDIDVDLESYGKWPRI